MTQDTLVSTLSYLEPILCAMVLTLVLRSKEAKRYLYLVALLAVKVLSSATCLGILYSAASWRHVLEPHVAYHIYFYVYWISYALEALLFSSGDL
jgi:hypothetical protein